MTAETASLARDPTPGAKLRLVDGNTIWRIAAVTAHTVSLDARSKEQSLRQMSMSRDMFVELVEDGRLVIDAA